MVIGRLDQVREPRLLLAQPRGPFAAAVEALRISGIWEPQRGELGHERADRVLAGLHCDISPGAAILQHLGPSLMSIRPALALERSDYAGLHKARLADA